VGEGSSSATVQSAKPPNPRDLRGLAPAGALLRSWPLLS
jgi:hypothetical protein